MVDDYGISVLKGTAWITDDLVDLKLPLMKIEHAENAAHTGAESTWNALRERYTWTDQRYGFRAFVSECLLWIMAKTGHKEPPPLYTNDHSRKPKDIINFDYHFLRKICDTEEKT